MGYKAATTITKPVELPSGYQATIRMLRKGDEDALTAIMMGSSKPTQQVTVDNQSKNTTIVQQLDNSAYTTELIVRSVTSWNLDDDAKNILPITAETVIGLTKADSNTLIKEINALGGEPDAASKSGDSSLPA